MFGGSWSDLLAGELRTLDVLTFSCSLCYTGPRNENVSPSEACHLKHLLTIIYRRKPYNALKVDVWSLGATVWETAESEPPFADVQDPRQIGDRWPSLSQPEIYSRSFHDFLRLCSEPPSSRPDPSALLNVRLSRPLIRKNSANSVHLRLPSSAMPAGALSMSNCFHNVELSKRTCSSRRMLSHRNLYIHHIPGRLSYSPISPIFLYPTYVPCSAFHGLFQSMGLFHDKVTFIFRTLCKECSCFCNIAYKAMSEGV